MTSVCVIGIYVDDMDKAVEFYCEKLGFKEAQRYNDGCIVRLENDGPPLILEKVEKQNKIEYPGKSQIVLGIETDNIEKAVREMRNKGIEFLYDSPQAFVAGFSMAMRDPSGNVLELLQFNKE
ncbi:MAG: VOC family protein [Candidatus Thorarchaeota archaeon]|nr:VOC family protein [Candidatus Thorarchaeota archaeon]